MSKNREKRLAVLYLVAFAGLILISASPFARSVDNFLGYVTLPLFVLLSVLASYNWVKEKSPANQKESGQGRSNRLEAFLKKLPPL